MDPRIVEQLVQHFVDMKISPEMLHQLIKVIEFVLQNPDKYGEVLEAAVNRGLISGQEVPPQFDETYLTTLLQALSIVHDQMGQHQEFAKGGLASLGRGGDTILAHINPREAEVLRRMGGSGTVNPNTGLMEYKGGGGWIAPVLMIAGAAMGVPALMGGALGATGTSGAILGGGLMGAGVSAATGGDPVLGALGGGLGGAFGSAFGGETLGNGISTGAGGGLQGLESGMGNAFGEAAGDTLGGGISGGLQGGMEGTFGGIAGQATSSAAGEALGSGLGMSGAQGITYAPTLDVSNLNLPSTSSVRPDLSGVNLPGAKLLPSVAGDAQIAVKGAETGFYDMVPESVRNASKLGYQGYKGINTAMGLYNALNPPDPRVTSQMHTQEMMGMSPLQAASYNRSFGLSGNQSRGAGQLARFKSGGKVR